MRFARVAPPAVASGIPGTPSVYSLEKHYAMPISTVGLPTNINSRTPNGWTYNPLGMNAPTGGYIGNGFNGSNV